MRPIQFRYYKVVMPDGAFSYVRSNIEHQKQLWSIYLPKEVDIIHISKSKYDHEVNKYFKDLWEDQ